MIEWCIAFILAYAHLQFHHFLFHYTYTLRHLFSHTSTSTFIILFSIPSTFVTYVIFLTFTLRKKKKKKKRKIRKKEAQIKLRREEENRRVDYPAIFTVPLLYFLLNKEITILQFFIFMRNQLILFSFLSPRKFPCFLRRR